MTSRRRLEGLGLSFTSTFVSSSVALARLTLDLLSPNATACLAWTRPLLVSGTFTLPQDVSSDFDSEELLTVEARTCTCFNWFALAFVENLHQSSTPPIEPMFPIKLSEINWIRGAPLFNQTG